MILRDFATAIANRDWATVVVEILIVVIGIFIGLQVDDWNQARLDRQDEQAFIVQLHGDVLLAEQLSARVRTRRLENLRLAIQATDLLNGRIDREALTDDECRSIGGTSIYNIPVSDLPSFNELLDTGRLHILRNDDLRAALLRYEQSKNSLNQLIMIQTMTAPDIARLYPDLVQRETYFNVTENEVRSIHTCDTGKMRASTSFLNEFGIGLDMYDAYVRDGLAPWSDSLDRVHALLDEALGIRHEAPPE